LRDEVALLRPLKDNETNGILALTPFENVTEGRHKYGNFWRLQMAGRGLIRYCAVLASSSLLWLFAYFMNNFYEAARLDVAVPRISILISFFNWLAYFSLSAAALIPSVIMRYFVPGREMEAEWAVLGAFVNGGTVIMAMALPWRLVTDGIGSGLAYYLISCLLKIIVAGMIILCGYWIVTQPDSGDAREGFAPPLDNAAKCMLCLKDFIDLAKTRLSPQTDAEKLWQTVFSYIKNDALITDAVNKGMPIDSIVMNAVGAVAYKLIESGLFHSSKGVLSPEGHYIALVWKLAADELINRSYNTREDMERGLAALTETIARTG
jgi:hypothetical protein